MNNTKPISKYLWRSLSSQLIPPLLLIGLALLIGGTIFLGLKKFIVPSSPKEDQSDVTFDIAPNGRSIIFVGIEQGRHNLYLLDLSTKHVTRLTSTEDIEGSPKFSPDGKSYIYTSSSGKMKPAHVFIQTLDGKIKKQITTGETSDDNFPAFSPDGSHIVFARASWHRPYSMGGMVWDNWNLYTIDENGNNLLPITNLNYYQLDPPTFSKDGKQILFSAITHSQQGITTDIYTVDKSALHAPTSITHTGKCSFPSYSPDGGNIVFVSDSENEYWYDILIMNTSGKNASSLKVTARSAYNQQPHYTPDGNHILFLGTPDPSLGNRFNLYQVGINGGDLRMLADSRLFDVSTPWKASNPVR